MTTNLYNISQVLGISIVHSLWQGMLIYIVLRCIFYAAPALSALKKYYMGLFAMAAMFILFAFTLASAVGSFSWGSPSPQFGTLLPNIHLLTKPAPTTNFEGWLAPYMPYICTAYIAGLLFNLVKLGWDWRNIRLIKQSALSAEQMQQYINKFAGKLGISKNIGIKFSEVIDVPFVIGYIKPLILLPVSLSTQLSACEVESILLHELAHIKRNDYLVNLLQQAVSAMLFFNPFSRLINRVINQERENSCDDLVIAKTGKPLIYARALLKLETVRTETPQLALAATGKKFHLLKRIERIMKTQQQQGYMRHFFITLLLLAGGICCIAWFNPVYAKIKINKTEKPAYALTADATAIADTTGDYTRLTDTGKHKTKAIKHKTLAKKHVVRKSNDAEVYDYSDDTTGYFHSQEWKSQMAAIQRQGEELKKQFNSPEWKAQQEQWKTMGEQMKKQFNSPEWKAQQEEWRKMGEDLKKQFDSPEWKAQQEEWRKQGEQFKKRFDSKEWRQQMDEIKKMGDQMRKQFESKEWKDSFKNHKWMWKDSTGAVDKYKPAPKDSVR